VNFSLWHSIRTKSVMTDRIEIDGLRFKASTKTNADKTPTKFGPIVMWLANQQEVVLKQSQIHIDGKRVVSLHKLNVDFVRHNAQDYSLYMRFTEPTVGPQMQVLTARVQGALANFAHATIVMQAHFVGDVSALLPFDYAPIRSLQSDSDITLAVSDGKMESIIFDGVLSQFIYQGQTRWEVNAAKGIHMHIDATATQGSFALTSAGVYVGANKLFAKAWPPLRFHMLGSWQMEGKGHTLITLQPSKVFNSNVSVNLNGSLNVDAAHPGRSRINLMGTDSIMHATRYLPAWLPQNLNPALYAWLTKNIIAAPRMSGHFAVQGSLNNFPYTTPNTGTFGIEESIQNFAIVPFSHWPEMDHINGGLHFNGSAFWANLSGMTMGTSLQSVTVRVPLSIASTTAELHVSGQVRTTGSLFSNYVNQSPLDTILFHLQHKLTLTGPFKGQVDMHFPLGANRSAQKTSGEADFANNLLAVNHSPFVFSNLTGRYHFAGEHFVPTTLRARLMGAPATIVFGRSGPHNMIDITGRLGIAPLTAHYPLLKNLVSGHAPFSAHLWITPSSLKVGVKTDLKGVAFHVPAPYAKKASQRMPSQFNMYFGGKAPWFSGQLGSYAAFAGVLNAAHTTMSKLHVRLGVDTLLPKPTATGWSVDGSVPTLNLKTWMNFSKKIKGSGKVHINVMDPLGFVKVHFGLLDAWGQAFPLLTVQWVHGAGGVHQLLLSSNNATGSIGFPQKPGEPYVASFTRLYLQKHHKDDGKKLMPSDLATWPPILFSVQSFGWSGYELGKVRFVLSHDRKGQSDILLAIHDKELIANISGSAVAKDDTVNFSGTLSSSDWGKALSSLGYKDLMSKGQGNANFTLSWQGAVNKPNVDNISGSVTAKLENGEVLSVNPGFMRFIGLVNISTIFDHFNLSSAGKKGLAFNDLAGTYTLSDGVAKTKDVHLYGPALNMVVKGKLNLHKKTMNQYIVVIPQVSGSLAIAATLIGGPIAGIATYLTDKLLTNTVLKDKGILYHVSGPWSKPVVENMMLKSGNASTSGKTDKSEKKYD
jgi:uncharacterized protein YhdP